ncbi:XrtA/PEP-CTERM system TPR-repeat protein PrsT [Rhizomicrobium electricum]|uniref:PEP-CTERM system TPR-repeat protein PrsT n=1 Tax=Rhizomicrobium electricum TaxID=480070 RepID=A0ABP3PLN7_9PROT|nr:XrtA/PEP-CTERM system TPR-repeat protein PrsT [Rhizomicrobium electricum]NIJ46897.1 putative PEP-CTERM system TPR-repeat lipoprotein [Rhizomicrobium electricum]
MTNIRRALTIAAAVGALAGVPAAAAIPNAASSNSNNPSGLGDLLRQAHQAMSQGHPNVAVIYLKNAAALAPKNANVKIELGYAYLQSGDAASAVRELRAARQAGAPDARVLPLLFDAMLARSEGQALLDQFPAPAAGDRSPLAATTLRARALALATTGHPDDAIASIDSALAINRDAPSLVVRARLAKDKKDMATALKLSEEAYAKASGDLNVQLLRISLLQASDHADQALGIADNMVKRYPDNPVSYLSRAGVLIQLKQDGRAKADIDTVLKRWKNLPQAQYFQALLFERAKNTKAAWAAAQALPPEFINGRPEIAVMVAQIAAADGHSDVAITVLNGAVARNPGLVEPRVILAAHYLKANNTQRALDILLPLKDSGEPRVMALLGQTYAMRKDTAKSTEYFDKASSGGFGGDLLKQRLAASNIQQGNYDDAVKQLRELVAKQPGDAINVGMLVAAQMRAGDIAGASTTADKFVAAAPKSPYGPLYQGQILLAKQNLDGAIAAFGRSLALDPKFVLGLYNRAVAKAARGDVNGANGDLTALLAADPKNVMAMIRSAELQIRMGQQEKAEDLLKRAVATDPKNPTPNLALSTFYITRSRLKEAGGVIGSYLKTSPNDINAQMVQAEIQLASGQNDPALATFRKLAAQRPDSPQVQLMLASALVAKKDSNGAMAAYKKALQLAPKFTLARTALVRYAIALNKPDVALAAAEDGIKQDPSTNSDLLYASTLTTLKRNDQAMAVLKKSQAQRPSENGAIMLSQLLRQTKKAKEADQVLTSWSAKHPGDVGARLELAQQVMMSQPDTAEREFRAVLKTQPQNMVALNNLSWLLQKKDTKQALVYAEQAAKLAPNSAPVLDTLGWVKWQAKDAQGAFAILQKAHALDANNAEIAYHLAVVQNATGRRAEAKKTLAAVIASSQDFSERKDAMALNGALR